MFVDGSKFVGDLFYERQCTNSNVVGWKSIESLEQLCMKSFLYHGHQVDLYAYTDIKGVPSGVIMRYA